MIHVSMPSRHVWCLKASASSSSSLNNFHERVHLLFPSSQCSLIHRCSVWCTFDGHFGGPYERYGIAWFPPSVWWYHFEYRLYHIWSFRDLFHISLLIQWHRMMHCMFEKFGLKQTHLFFLSILFCSFFRSSIYPWGSQVCMFVISCLCIPF